MVQSASSRKDFAGFSGAGASNTVKEAEITDDFCFDIDTDLVAHSVSKFSTILGRCFTTAGVLHQGMSK